TSGAASLGRSTRLERAVGELARAIERDVAQDGWMHELVDEAHLIALLRPDVPPRENHVERTLQPDESRQPLRPTGAWDEAKLHLGQREHRLRMIGCDAIVAGQRSLQTAAEASPVNRGDDGNAQQIEALEQRLSTTAERLGIGRARDHEELVDVGAGNPGVGLPREE